MSIESVKTFYVRLATDEAFRGRFENTASTDERTKLLQDAGYNFTQEEFEAATAQILESESIDSELSELSKEEMAAVVGGAVSSLIRYPILPLPLYGIPPIKPWPGPQPMYGIVRLPED